VRNIFFLDFLNFKLISILVIQKVATISNEDDDENALIPQWAIAMITIGVLSLVCVILFGVVVVS
jgi:hypothetical protein